MVKEGAAVIDVGMDRDENGKLCGDVDFDNVEKVAGYITPRARRRRPDDHCHVNEKHLNRRKNAKQSVNAKNAVIKR